MMVAGRDSDCVGFGASTGAFFGGSAAAAPPITSKPVMTVSERRIAFSITYAKDRETSFRED